MSSEKSANVQKRSFIEEARRAQIVEAAIDVLNEVGYAKASLAKIAAKASISTSLTLYHFKDKQALMIEVMMFVDSGWSAYVEEKMQHAKTAREQLRAFIEANLAYMGTRPRYFRALMELYFNGKDLDMGDHLYSAKTDPSLATLRQLLEAGQQSGEFQSFDSDMMAVMIRGALDQFLGYLAMQYDFDLEAYTDHLISVFERVIIKEKK